MNHIYSDIMRKFTKYVNRRLKNVLIIDTWAIYMDDEEKHILIIEIDYIGNFHSRDMYPLREVPAFNIDLLIEDFENRLDKHADEFIDKVKEKINESQTSLYV